MRYRGLLRKTCLTCGHKDTYFRNYGVDKCKNCGSKSLWGNFR